MQFIDTEEQLNNVITCLKAQKIIAFDTEFVRTNTYFAELSLIQVATFDNIFIIDARVNMPLAPLSEIFFDNSILKICHAPRQDIEIFRNNFNKIMALVFDTQIAAALVGLGTEKSYEELCKKICAVTLDKTEQFSNWHERPLTEAKLKYAADDVRYLFSLYKYLDQRLQSLELYESFYTQVQKQLCHETLYNIDLMNCWKKVRCLDKKNPILIERLRHLAAFREECAISLNIPRRHFISDKDLVKIGSNLPTNQKQFDSISLSLYYLKKYPKYRNKLFEICLGIRENIS